MLSPLLGPRAAAPARPASRPRAGSSIDRPRSPPAGGDATGSLFRPTAYLPAPHLLTKLRSCLQHLIKPRHSAASLQLLCSAAALLTE
eukprot:9179941-Lingulodinium_polyedra.AAC.1